LGDSPPLPTTKMTYKKHGLDFDLGTDWLRGTTTTVLQWLGGSPADIDRNYLPCWGWGTDSSESLIVIEIIDGGYRVGEISYSCNDPGDPLNTRTHESFELAVADLKARAMNWLIPHHHPGL